MICFNVLIFVFTYAHYVVLLLVAGMFVNIMDMFSLKTIKFHGIPMTFSRFYRNNGNDNDRNTI